MKNIAIFIGLVLLQSCYTLKPDSEALSPKDYNSRQTITKPILVKKRNALGVAFNVAVPLAAGYVFYEHVDPIVKNQKGSETVGVKPANAVIGILAMLSLNKIADFAMGMNKSTDIQDKNINRWISKAGLAQDYNFSADYASQELLMIPKSIESSFKVKNITDINDFYALFPKASNDNIGKVVNQGTQVLEHDDLYTMCRLYTNHTDIVAAKIKYIHTSKTYEEFLQRRKSFMEVEVDDELISSDLVASISNLGDFLKKFPSSPHTSKVIVYSFKNEYAFYDLTNRIIQEYNVFDLEEATFSKHAKSNQTIIDNYMNAIFAHKKINRLRDLAYFYTEKQWLTQKVSANNKLEKAWQIGYNEYANGDDLVYLIHTFSDFDWNLSKNQITSFVNGKLGEEIDKHVHLTFNTKKSETDMEKWRKESYASATIVGVGEIVYLIYGDVVNNSKFTLPVEVFGSSDVFLKNEGLLEYGS